MNDIQPGDVVQIVSSEFCRQRPGHRTDNTFIGRMGRVLSVWKDHEYANFYRANLTIARDRGGACIGCLRPIRSASNEFTRHIRALKPVLEDA